MFKHIDSSFAGGNGSQSKSTYNAEHHISMVTARNKLKQVEDKIYEAHYRLHKLNKKQSKAQYQKMHQTQMLGLRQHIREFANTKSEIKRQYLSKKSVDVQKWHDINMERRACHKDKILQMKDMLHTQNKWVYQNIRKQKEINEDLIRRQRGKQYEHKRNRRDQMFADQQRRLSYMKQFLKNKHLTAKLSKQNQTNDIQNQILKKKKFLTYLERQASQISINPQSMSGSRSLQGSQDSNSKGFRLIKNKKQILN